MCLHRRPDPDLRCHDAHARNVSSYPWRDAQGAPAQHASLDRELHVDYFTVIGIAAGDQEAITDKVQEGGDPQTLLDNRHLVLCGDKASSVMKVWATVLRAFRQTYVEQRCLEVTPPCMVQTQVEGGAALF
jgi:asparaginyl-tRNA synthetase